MAWTLITGGAKGLGAQLCYTLAELKIPLAIHYNTSTKEAFQVVEKCKALGGEAEAIQGDFSTAESTLDFVYRYQKQFGETKNLINNVGNYLIKSALETEIIEWISLFQTNLHAPFILTKHLIPSLIHSQGHIINIGVSGLETRQARTYSTAYTLAKECLLSLTRALAYELAPKGVKVNMISPGYLDTSIKKPEPHQLPMGRTASCGEVARVLTFLLDPASGYLTGQNVEVAGGIGLK
ncbi:MAG: SDR family oxidoreductase [Candidatus Protochlamydia sp.]|nr:SDR family oxidoreductase [Candidatus Protochlamydia sp.]